MTRHFATSIVPRDKAGFKRIAERNRLQSNAQIKLHTGSANQGQRSRSRRGSVAQAPGLRLSQASAALAGLRR